MFYTKDTSWFVIELNSITQNIAVRQKWKYNWITSPGVNTWTYSEKKAFHHKLDNLVWGNWGAHLKLKIRGNSEFVRVNKNFVFSIYFDIKWVLDSPHWTVEVTKIQPGDYVTSSLSWATKTINLDTEDVKLVTRTENSKDYHQYPGLHEIGHGFGNSIFAYTNSHGDEYKNTSVFNNDKSSLMNIGNELRTRHIDFLLRELNGVSPLIPNTEFYV